MSHSDDYFETVARIESLAEIFGYEPKSLLIEEWYRDEPAWVFYEQTYHFGQALVIVRADIKVHWRIRREIDNVIIAQSTV